MEKLRSKEKIVACAEQLRPKEKIVACAEQLILKKGVSDTTVHDIASAVGISKGTLYYHFKSKEEIVCAVADKYFASVDEAIVGLINCFSQHEVFEEVLIKALDFFNTKSIVERMHYILMAYALTSNSDLKARFAQRYTLWRDMIKATLDAISEEPTNISVAEVLLAIVDGLVIKNIMGIESLATEDVRALVRKFDFMNNIF